MRNKLLILIALVLAAPALSEVFYEDAEEMLVERVADTDTLIPCPTPVPFTTFRYPHLNAFMDVTVIADDNSYYKELKGEKHGIYRSYSKSGEIVTLVSSDDLAPGTDLPMILLRGLQTYEDSFVFNGYTKHHGSKGLYASFNGEPYIPLFRGGTTNRSGKQKFRVGWGAIHGTRVVYTKGPESELRLYDHITKKTVTLVKRDTAVHGYPDRKFAVIRQQNWLYEDSVVFRAHTYRQQDKHLYGPMGVYLIEEVDPEDPSTYSADKIIRIADANTIMPKSNGMKLSNFTSAPIDSGRIAFRASGYRVKYKILPLNHPPPFYGIYTWKDGDLQAIVDTETFIPGKDVKFTGFDKWVTCDKGKVIFRGQGPDGFEGLFLFDPAQETLFMFNDTTDLIDGKKVKEFQIGSNCLIGNRVVFTVIFEDKSMGIYLAALPKVIARIKDSRLDPIITHPLAD